MNLDYKKTILIIEQDADIRHCLKEVIETEGYRVLATENKTEAHSLLKVRDKPAFVLMDTMTSAEYFPDFDSLQMATLERPINLDHLLKIVSQIN